MGAKCKCNIMLDLQILRICQVSTWMFFKWFFKAAVAIYLVTNTLDIVMAVFDIGQNVVTGAAGVISGDTNIDIESPMTTNFFSKGWNLF